MSAESGAYATVRPDHARRLHWSWRCRVEGCGWVGLDLRSEEHADREAQRHQRDEHFPCHNGHPFVRGRNTDNDPPSRLWCNVCGEARGKVPSSAEASS